jgi:alkylation response protein AidB-like acyl-CoA dehydrogenase
MPTSKTITPPTTTSRSAEEVLERVNALVPILRARAPETEKLRRMHPDTLRDLTEAGVFRLTVPADVAGNMHLLIGLGTAAAQAAYGSVTHWSTNSPKLPTNANSPKPSPATAE